MTQSETPKGMSRKERRSIGTQASRLYGVKDRDDALAIYEAYQALNEAEVSKAARLVQPLIAKDLRSEHPYIILGRIALAEYNGPTAKAFFAHALSLNEKGMRGLAGMGTALTLEADVFEGVKYLQQALEAGHNDPGTITLFEDLMRRMGRLRQAAEALVSLGRKADSAEAYLKAANIYTEGEFFDEAADAYLTAFKKAPAPVANRVGRLKAALFKHDYEYVLREGPTLLEKTQDGEIAVILMNSLRVMGRAQEALDLLETFEFQNLEQYQRALGVQANIKQDDGDTTGAIESYELAMAVSDQGQEMIAKAYGAFRLRDGDFFGGADLYAKRQPATNRAKVPYENSLAENLRSLKRAVLIGEQGIGDQLALIPQAVASLRKHGVETYSFVGDPRLNAALADNTLSLQCHDQNTFSTAHCQSNEIIFIGDLVRHRTPDQKLGGYISPEKRFDYRDGSRPVIGVSWKSGGTLSGHLRSFSLEDLLSRLPEDAVVVNLQYGDTKKEIKDAQRAFPKMSFVTDPEVDQMVDMRSFLQQLASVDTIVSIDNTTVHAAGAIGHENTHVLLPAGSETMWYWGSEGGNDPWYGKLHLHRQAGGRDWTPALASLQAALQVK